MRRGDAQVGLAISARLAGRRGRELWRGLEELAGTPEFEAFLAAEFPGLPEIDRRTTLRVMGASLALAGLGGCDWPTEQRALPYVTDPEAVVPGEPNWYATAVTMAGYARPVIGETRAGRPIKLEGNPAHPLWRGATDAFLQAALLGLYDPDRSQVPRELGRPTSWAALDTALTGLAAEADRRDGEGLRFLTGTVTSPTLSRQIDAALARWPEARWHAFEPVGEDARLDAARLAFGRALQPQFHLDEAEVVVSLDDDLLGAGPHLPPRARRWSERRRAFRAGDGGCRILMAEPAPTPTGAMATPRLAVAPHRIGVLATALAASVGLREDAPALDAAEAAWVAAAAAALERAPGRALVTAGAYTAVEIQALAFQITARLDGVGGPLRFTEPVRRNPGPEGTLARLLEEARSGEVGALVIVGSNPAYTAPAALDVAAALERVPLRVHAGLHYDETAELCQWHAPLAHELESWGDARASDGTASILQPLVRSFYAVRPAHAFWAGLLGSPDDDHATVQATWAARWGEAFQDNWRDALLRGFVPGTEAAEVGPTARPEPAEPPEAPAEALEVVVRPHPCVWDGTFANNAWLQETPAPLTKVTWGNVIAIAPALAEERGIRTGDALILRVGGRSVLGAAWISPGQAPGTVAVTLGHGRRRVGRVGDGVGYDAYPLLPADGALSLAGGTLEWTGERITVPTTQLHQAMHGYDFVRTLRPGEEARTGEPPPTFYGGDPGGTPAWGMSIDLDACIGCNACLVACVAENNIPVVGPEAVAQGREMHWMRVDRYHEGPPEDPKTHFQPVPCMHCEDAPCEMGCPVNAAVHNAEGLNLQVYNRCIGTRTCSSYCPYKVRRFNWFDYTGDAPPELRAIRNPEVTVRSRGVMEKCTYCVQRISAARIEAKKEERPIRDGEVVTACQQACPTEAIVFGDVSDPDTLVSRRKAEPRDYTLLEEANTRPRTTYLARVEPDRDGDGS